MARAQKRRVADSDAEEESSGSATDYEDRRAHKTQKKSAGKKKDSRKAGKGKGKGKRRARDDSDDEEEEEATDSSDDEGAGKGKKGELTEDEKKHYIQAMVRYILFNESHRRILKREDIVKNVLVDGRGRYFNNLLPKVQKILKDVLGLELVLLRQKETATGKNQAKSWLLRSAVPQPLVHQSVSHLYRTLASEPSADLTADSGGKRSLRAELAAWEADGDEDDDEEDQDGAVMRDVKREEGEMYGLLGIVLALILVNGKVLGDDQLISYLRRLALTPSSVLPSSLASAHPTSHTLSTFLNNLVKQQYLERSKTGQTSATQGSTQAKSGRATTQRTQRTNAEGGKTESGDPSIEWRWGPRAEAELGELGIGKFVEAIFMSQSEVAGENGGRAKGRGKTGERFLAEVARSAGVKALAGTEVRARNDDE
ncbi:hypothetical protein OF846_003262 [Rhodotorula toruloides]|nr:hypothetical protein OF846_003262 [Rhodotorula toruloides]